jgi:hypothetical protein
LKFTVDEPLTDCEDAPSFTNLYDTNVTLEQISDDIIELNGYAIVKPDLKPNLPLTFVVTSEYFDRGTWTPGPGFTTHDVCGEMANPKRPWYSVVETFEGDAKLCPHRAGAVFHFDGFQYETIIKKAQPVFAGDWRVRMTMSQQGIGHFKQYCCKGKFSVSPL